MTDGKQTGDDDLAVKEAADYLRSKGFVIFAIAISDSSNYEVGKKRFLFSSQR